MHFVPKNHAFSRKTKNADDASTSQPCARAREEIRTYYYAEIIAKIEFSFAIVMQFYEFVM
jgi:hypothetical protein